MTPTKRLFSVSDVACIRGGRILFQNLSFGLDPGEVIHLAGPNGAGKTSLLRIICGALPPALGKIKWDGHDFMKDGIAAHAKRYAFLPAGDNNLKSAETAAENLRFWAEYTSPLLPPERDKAVTRALEKMGIEKLKDTPVRQLSAGQKRRLSLARVFLREVKLWLLDEPLNGLDMKSYDLLVDALDAHCKGGGMAILASHYTVAPPKHGTLKRVEVGYK